MFLPVVFVGKGVKVFLFLMNDVLQAFVDRSAAVTHLLQTSLKDDHVADHRIFQHVNLQDRMWMIRMRDSKCTLAILCNKP